MGMEVGYKIGNMGMGRNGYWPCGKWEWEGMGM